MYETKRGVDSSP